MSFREMIEALYHLWDPDGYAEVPYTTKRNAVLLGGVFLIAIGILYRLVT